MIGWRKRQILDLGSIAWRQPYAINPQHIASKLIDADFEVPEPPITDFNAADEFIQRIKNRK